MLKIALRDLQWRRRRILIAIAGASLVIALALVMSGLSAGLENEARRTVQTARATSWVIDEGGTGPFLQPTPLDAGTVASVVGSVGADHAAPILFGRQSVHHIDGSSVGEHAHVNLVGVVPGRLGAPLPSKGDPLVSDTDAVVDTSLGVRVGEQIMLGTKRFTVRGTVSGARLLAGVSNAYVSLHAAQQLGFGGRDLASAVVTDRPVTAPPGTRVLDNDEARVDGLRPVVNAEKTIAMVRSLLWLVAALIIGSVLYVSVLERTKDVAVLKGLGTRTRSLAGSLAAQAALLALCASVFGALLALVLAPLFPLSAEIPASAFALLPLLAVAVGVVASIGALRRLAAVQPALAFGR